VIFGQSVCSAELAATVRTLEWQKSFLPALLTFHVWRTPFHAKRLRSCLYVSLQKGKTKRFNDYLSGKEEETEKERAWQKKFLKN